MPVITDPSEAAITSTTIELGLLEIASLGVASLLLAQAIDAGLIPDLGDEYFAQLQSANEKLEAALRPFVPEEVYSSPADYSIPESVELTVADILSV